MCSSRTSGNFDNESIQILSCCAKSSSSVLLLFSNKDLITFENGIGRFALDGDLNKTQLPALKKEIEKLTGLQGVILDMTNLKTVDDIGWNYLLFTKQQRGAAFSVKLTGLNAQISQGLKDAELDEEFQVI